MKKISRLLKPLLLAIVAAVISPALPAGAQSVWNATSGVSANTNWSSSVNWLPAVVPTAFSNVLFIDTATTVPGAIDNVVDANTTVQQLVFRQTNGVHNMLIPPGVTLTVSNAVATTNLLAGTENVASPTTLMVTNTISGAGGTLTVVGSNSGSGIIVRQITSGAAGSHISVLDLSGLGNFNATVSNIWVGVFPANVATRPQGAFYLARTNNLSLLAVGTKSAPSIDVGDTGNSPDVNNLLVLGITNNIAADTMVIGNQQYGSFLIFNPAFTNGSTPSLFLRGHSNPRVTTFNIGDESTIVTAGVGSSASGVADFSGGTIDAMVDAMAVGSGESAVGAGTARGTLTLTAGTLNVNTLETGFNAVSGAVGVSAGTNNINGGTLIVNTSLRLARLVAGGTTPIGVLNINGGTVQANSIVAGGGISMINLNGGTLMVSNTMGSVAAPLSAVNVNNNATLQFSVVNGVTAATTTNLSSDSTGVINISSLPAIAGYPSQPFPLISFQTGGSGVAFALSNLPSTFKGTISNDNSSTIWLVITNGPSLASVAWGGGVNNLWDTNTLNWTNNANAVKYVDLDVVSFGDSAKTNKVNMTGTFAPAAWLQNNNSLNYTFSGIGSITGSGGLVMNGSASVTLAETGGDNFSGGIIANAGIVVLDDANGAISGGLTIANGATVQIGINDANGALPSGGLNSEGVLIFSRTDNVVVNTAILGGGALTQNGSGTLTLSAANLYAGNTTVNAGTLALTNSGSIVNSAQVDVTGATLDVSGVSGKATLTSLNLTNAGLTVSVGYLQTNFLVTSLNLGGATNRINVSALPPIASYPATVTLVQSAGGISGFNMGVGTLPSGYIGDVALSGDTTAVLLTLTSGPFGIRPYVTWDGVDALNNVSTNWSDAINWQSPGAPVAGDAVVFNNTATSGNGSDLSTAGGGAGALLPENINNFVDKNFTVASLTYTNNGGSYHNTAITNGATLTITNFFTVGGVNSASTLQQEFVNVAGTRATLNVDNTNSNFQVWVGNSGTQLSYAALDLSALDNFTANVSKLTVGACAVDNAVNRPSGILYLARTNTIACAFQSTNSEAGSTTGNSGLILGDCNQNQGPTSFIYLGQVNTISADTIGIARQKSSGTVQFNSIYANIAPYPTVTFKGFSSTLVSNFDIGDGIGNTGTTAGTGDLNLAGGFVTATVDTMNISRASGGASGSGITTGSLEFDAGTITANTVNVGLQPAMGTKVGVGSVDVDTNNTTGAGAILVVNGTLNLGVNAGGTGAATNSGTLNINGGTVQANTIAAGVNGATSTINLNSGKLIITNSAGTTAAPLTTLSLSDGTTLQLNVNGGANVTNIVATGVTTSGTIILKIGSLTSVATNITYPLISYTGTDPYSSFSSPVFPPGYTGSLVDNSGVVGLKLTGVPAAPAQPAHITGISVSGTILNLSATNGVHGGPYVLLGTTNLAKPLSQWTPLLTNNFNGSGNLSLSTNIINPVVPQQFYNLSQ